MSEVKLNRQARLKNGCDLHCDNDWQDFGNVSLFEAARRLAMIEAETARYPSYVWEVEVRCETSPEIPVETYQVRTSLVADVLNPRKGSD